VKYEPNTLLKALPASLGQLGALKKLTLCDLMSCRTLLRCRIYSG